MKGTLLLPDAAGSLDLSCGPPLAIAAKFSGLRAPTRYGVNFLTYVLWAVTPERQAINVGELMRDGSDRAKLDVKMLGRTLGFLLTAEPYFAVSFPSNAVVLETALPITAPVRTVTLSRRPSYTYDVFSSRLYSLNAGKPVTLDEYQRIVMLYEAQSALAAAQAAGADRYAKEQYARAQSLLNDANRGRSRGLPRNMVLQLFREATFIAEGARAAAEQARAKLAAEARSTAAKSVAVAEKRQPTNRTRARTSASKRAARGMPPSRGPAVTSVRKPSAAPALAAAPR
ncbi:MAG TPA: hypothetical protein VGF59_18975 [Bryobacteraceae bacterium]